jgi:FkbM family methyltransferase
MAVKKANNVDPEPLFARQLRYRLWDMFRPSYGVKAGVNRLKVPAVSSAASRFPVEWPITWRVGLMQRVFALRPGAFVDVGANVGQTLIDYLACGDERGYFGFEPNPECVILLNDLVRANGLDHLLVAPVGLAQENMVLKLFVKKESDSDKGGSLVADLRPGNEFRTILVPCYKFDDVRDQLGIGAMSLIKIDVEGAELGTLAGMKGSIAQFKPWIALEVLYRDSQADAAEYDARVDALRDFLNDVGYAIFRLDKPHDESGIDSLTQMDDFPRLVWTKDNKHLCDYLLVPAADAAQAATLY